MQSSERLKLPQPKRIKVLHLTGLAHGGSGEHILSLAKATDRRRFDISVGMAKASPMLPRFVDAGIRVVPLALDHGGHPARNAVAFAQISRLIRRERFDIVHTHTSVAGALGRVAAKTAGMAKTVHMLHSFASHQYMPWGPRQIGLAAERILDKFTDHYVAASRAMIEHGEKNGIFRPTSSTLIPNGVDVAAMDTFLTTPRRPLRTELGVHHETPLVGLVGRLEKAKGCEFFLRAIPSLLNRISDCKYLICGCGALRGQLEQLANRLGIRQHVTFLGWRSDVWNVLSSLDLLVMPSLWESFGLVAAEAMALRVPVIASAVDGLKEVVENGVSGRLVTPEDFTAVADEVVSLMSDPRLRREMGQAGRRRVERDFTVNRMVAAHEQLYERILLPHFARESDRQPVESRRAA